MNDLADFKGAAATSWEEFGKEFAFVTESYNASESCPIWPGQTVVASDVPPNVLGFHVANMWPELAAHDGYAMGRNGKEPQNLDFPSVAATFEKANT